MRPATAPGTTAAAEPAPLCEMQGYSVSYYDNGAWSRVVHDVSLHIGRGEVLGLVGESGCGKSTVAMQFLGYRSFGSRVDAGRLLFEGTDLIGLDRRALDALRGRRIGFVPQNPTTALNPALTIGRQIAEMLLLHGAVSGRVAAARRSVELLDLVGLPQPAQALRKYPHQLSGGQQQRVCIAMALSCDPSLVVMDEPTTGLDVTTQRQIVDLLNALRKRIGLSLLYVTHDLALLSQIADRIGVMYAGHLVETAPVDLLFAEPRHPYARGLLASAPKLFRVDGEPTGSERLEGFLQRRLLPPGCPFAPRCRWSVPSCATRPQALEAVAPDHRVACQRWRDIEALHEQASAAQRPCAGAPAPDKPEPGAPPLLEVDGVTISYPTTTAWGLRGAPFVAVSALELSIRCGEILALVGESGSGKSTIARAIGGVLSPSAGHIALDGETLDRRVERRSREQRRLIQFIFQNPDASLNPRKRIGAILRRPLDIFFRLSGAEAGHRVAQALESTGLDPSYAERYPDQLSGGERQRVAIARALVAEPTLLICDEILSALDVSIQANILDLLQTVRRERQVTMLFISHDLAVVRDLADRVAVMYHGELMQLGATAAVYRAPFHPYSHGLLAAVPRGGRRNPEAEVLSETAGTPRRLAPAAAGRRSACAFAGRCPVQPGQRCVTDEPPLRHTADGTLIRCHLTLDELQAHGAGLSRELSRARPGPSPLEESKP